MKIGICSKEGEAVYKKLREYGYSYVDFQMADTEDSLYLCDEKTFEARLLHQKELAEAEGVRINQVHGPWRYPPLDGTVEERAERMEKMKKSIYGTSLLGCRNWVVHPLMPYGIQDKNTAYAKETWEINREFMGELLKTAKEYDITICLENMPMPEFSIGSPTEILEFVKMMNDEHFKICLDTGHVAVYEGLTPAGAVRGLGDEIRVLHVHDNNGKADQHLLPYFGIIDWEDFGRALKECNFDGVFSYETEPPKKLPASVFDEMSRLLVEIAKEIMSDKRDRKELI